MQVIVSGDAAAYVLDSETEITDPAELRKLDGLDYSSDCCANYLDESLLDIGVGGGTIRLTFNGATGRLRVVTEYRAPRRLKPAELKQLAAETEGQWSDGIGEGEFRHRKKLKMDVDLFPSNRAQVRTEQIDDGKKVKAPKVDALLKAIRNREFAKARELLRAGADLRGKDRYGDTPLHVACQEGAFDLAVQLVAQGADPHVANRSGATPLSQLAMADASSAKATKCVAAAEALLRGGAHVDAPDNAGVTPLMWAVNRGNAPLAEFLIKAGADVNAHDREKYNESTVLMYAQKLRLVELLLKHGADPSICNA